MILFDRVLGSRARRDAALLTAGRIVAALLSFVWLLVVARHLGPAEFGRLMTLLSLAAIVSFVHDGGHQFALTEAVARDTNAIRPAIRLVIRRRVALSALSAVVVTAVYGATFDGEIAPAVVFALSIVATAVYSSILAGLRGAEVIAPDAANEVFSRLFIISIGIPLVLGGGGLLTVTLAYGLTDVLSAIAVIVMFGTWARRRAVPASSTNFDRSGFRWARLWPLAAALAAGTLSYRVDIWMVAMYRGDTEVGLYGAAYRLLEGLLIPAGAISQTRLASIVRSPDNELARRLARLCGVTVAITAVPALLVAAIAPLVLELTFGGEYTDSAAVLRLLLAGSLATAAVIVVTPAIASRSRTSALAISTASVLANVGVNAALIPPFGARGAAFATLVTQGVTLLAAVLVLRRILNSRPLPALPLYENETRDDVSSS